MIVIFCDGSTHPESSYVGVGVIGFKADDNGKIIKHLFSLRSQFSAIYAPHQVHEDFAVIKAIEQAKNYPDEQVVICNDHLEATYKVLQGNISQVRCGARYHIWSRIDLSWLAERNITFKQVSRNVGGMKFVDILSKRYVESSTVNSEKFKNLMHMVIGKDYRQTCNKPDKNRLGIYCGNIKVQFKPNLKAKHIAQMSWQMTEYDKIKQRRALLREYIVTHPEFCEDPRRFDASYCPV